MARTTEFEPDVALKSAMDVFWDKGYFDTSMDDLINEMGVARYGVYNTWGNKRDLYLAALKKYFSNRVAILNSVLGKPDASLPEIKAFFAMLMSQQSGKNSGCFACNAAIELAAHDEEVSQLVRKMFSKLANVFRKVLKNAKDKGELKTDLSINELAEYLANIIRTAAVMDRSGYSAKQIESHIKIALKVLD